MSLEKEIKQGADEAIQQATGVPAPSLRGTVGPLQFIRERMAESAGVIPPGKEFSTEVKSNSIVIQPAGLPPAETATVVPTSGGQVPDTMDGVITKDGVLYHATIDGVLGAPV